MLRLFLFILPIALLDGISPIRIGAMAVLLGARRPWMGAGLFILGTLLSYFLLGVAVTVGADRALRFLASEPRPLVYGAGIAIGALLVVLGFRNLRARGPARRPVGPRVQGPGGAVVSSLALTVIAAPAAIPYLAAIDLILQSGLGVPEILGALAFYCIVFVMPLAVLVALRSALGPRSATLLSRIHRMVSTSMPRVIGALLLVLGLLMIVEGVAFFFSRPLLPVS